MWRSVGALFNVVASMLGARMRGGRPQEAAQRLPDGRKAIEGPWDAPEAEGTPASPVGPSEATTLDRLRRSEDRTFARENNQPGAAVSASTGKAKLFGLLKDKHEHGGDPDQPMKLYVITGVPEKE